MLVTSVRLYYHPLVCQTVCDAALFAQLYLLLLKKTIDTENDQNSPGCERLCTAVLLLGSSIMNN